MFISYLGLHVSTLLFIIIIFFAEVLALAVVSPFRLVLPTR